MGLPQIPRYRPGTDLLGFEQPPAGVDPKIIILKAEDGGACRGVLYTKGHEKTVVCVLHPRGDMTRHYLIPYFLEAGYAAFGHESRWPNNDSNASHEILLSDVAAAMRFVRSRGFDKIVLLGYSGGGSVYSLYQAQALTEPPRRLTHTAAGDPYDLNRFEMPPADGILFVAAHLGAGKMMQTELDPSIIDEGDPLSCDPSLDMYNADNGFADPPESSRYPEEFLARYRAAQIARVARIDAVARSIIAEQRQFRDMAQTAAFDKLPAKERAFISRRAMLGQFMQIHRTDANPAAVDLSITPSARSYGTINSLRPDLSNYSENGFARILTPRAWLSLWSGLSSRASVLDNLSKIGIPTAIVSYTGDNAIYPQIAETILQESPAADKQLFFVDGDHFGFPLSSKPGVGGRVGAKSAIIGWLRHRFPAA